MALAAANAKFLGEALDQSSSCADWHEEDLRAKQEEQENMYMIKTIHKRYPNMFTYEVRNKDKWEETDAKTHSLRIMRYLRNNDYYYLRLNATSFSQIRKLSIILELLNKWVYVEECLTDKGAAVQLDWVKRSHRDTPYDQLSVVISRSYDFGQKYL